MSRATHCRHRPQQGAHYKVSALSPRSPSVPAPTLLPVFALMLGATSWGILWYPFRLMQGAGLPAPVATLLSYLVSIVVGLLLFPRAWREFLPNTAWMLGIGLSAGFTNVAYLVAIPVALWLAPGTGQWLPLAAPHALLIAVIGAVLMSTSVTLQYGLSKLAANRAAVVLLFELVVAAVAAHFLAGEVSRLQDWAGGAMIVAAGMMAAFWEHRAAKLAAS